MPETPERPLEQLAVTGPWGGPTYTYRGAEIRCFPGGRVCGLIMPDHPLDSRTFGAPETVIDVVDSWLNDGQVPAYVPPARRA